MLMSKADWHAPCSLTMILSQQHHQQLQVGGEVWHWGKEGVLPGARQPDSWISHQAPQLETWVKQAVSRSLHG